MAVPICELTIAEIHRQFEAGSLSATALVAAYEDRIEAYDQQAAALNAIVSLNPEASAQAERLDAEYAASGKPSGPLHGIPVLVILLLAVAATLLVIIRTAIAFSAFDVASTFS